MESCRAAERQLYLSGVRNEREGSLVVGEHNVLDQRNRHDTAMITAPTTTRLFCESRRGDDSGVGPLRPEYEAPLGSVKYRIMSVMAMF